MKDTETWDKLEKIKDIALRAPKMADTRECYEQAQEIMRILDEDDVPVPESEFGGEGEEGQDGQGLSGDEQILSDAEKIKDQAAKDRFKFEREEDRYLIYTTEGDTIEAIDDEGDKQQCHRFLTDSRGLVYPIRQRFRRNLLSKAKCRWEPGKRRGSVNPASLHRVALGTSKAVFRKLSEADSFDTAVSMFVDHSGSMWSEKMELAAHTAIIFGECLHDIKVPFEVCGFSTQQSSIAHTRFQGASPDEQKLFTRWGDLWIGIYKGFDDHWPTNRHRCVNMNRNGKDNTFDGEALRVAAKRLLLRPEKRKILFWLNDGWPQPNMSRFRQQHATYLANMAKAVEKVIEVFAVGIMSDSVKEYFSNWVQVNNLSDLPKVAVTELDRLLRKRQNAYGGTRVA
jgi:cobaltochelatase CobT